MIDAEITPELEAKIAKAIMENKPYLLEIENRVADMKFGEMDVRLTIRGGNVDKVSFFKTETWVKDRFKEMVNS